MSLDLIRSAIAPLRQTLLEHPIYRDIRSPAAMRTFMEHHVFAVWDFMSLLKALQARICCVAVPWIPPTDSAASRLINEIVLGEESDENGQGGYASHFDLYHQAMARFGADTTKIDRFVECLRSGRLIDEGFQAAAIGEAVRGFVGRTFEIIGSRDLCRIASAFTFGREDLLPAVFQKIVDQLDEQTGGGLAPFKYYLKRHIDLDADEHGPMALRLVTDLCGDDEANWSAAQEAAVASLQARKTFWDAIHASVLKNG